ncbi:hypothetical protein FJ444_16810 [Aestuariibacter sp. GS-14]|uniref:hypothetical protein n=1 Tax=Aestuariibacter sp. GS-14 TaxID=2590670 RepID=UPI00112D73D2|nr:hypothetical protein [Aestuariibacter sp. GS-14]TPV55363.1 hypothetical protein FJ444_16810 [Aestuariibacter sp. GS-14]
MTFRKGLILAVVLLFAAAGIWVSQSVEPVNNEQDDTDLASLSFRQQILHASDLMAGVKVAIKQQDEQALQAWQQKAVDVAKAAELSEQDIEFIASNEGLEYLQFHANRALFNDELLQRYHSLSGIDDLKAQYPQAQDLFAKADNMIAQRDAIINEIAIELGGVNPPEKVALEEARRLWLQRFTSN